MKTITLIIGLALLAGCGKAGDSASGSRTPGACAGVGNGHWKMLPSTVTDPAMNASYYLDLNDNCTGSTTYCNEKFTYIIGASQTSATIIVSSANTGPDCLAVGTYSCVVSLQTNNDNLAINCGGGKTINHSYIRN